MCHLIFVSCHVHDTYFLHHFNVAIFEKLRNSRNKGAAKISCNEAIYQDKEKIIMVNTTDITLTGSKALVAISPTDLARTGKVLEVE